MGGLHRTSWLGFTSEEHYYNGQCECWVYFLMGSLACCWTDINFQPCRTLGEASSSGEHVLILSHIPFCPGACDPLCLLWNYDQVLEML